MGATRDSIAAHLMVDRPPYVYVSGILAGVWVIAAWLRPDANYFLFPVLIAAAMPVAYRVGLRQALRPGAALGAATAGLINVGVAALLLVIAGKLEGPSLIGIGGLVLEAAVLGVVGGLAGAAIAVAGR